MIKRFKFVLNCLARVILEEIIIFYQRTTQRKSNGNIVLQHLMTPRLVRVLLPCDQELLELALVRSPVSSTECGGYKIFNGFLLYYLIFAIQFSSN